MKQIDIINFFNTKGVEFINTKSIPIKYIANYSFAIGGNLKIELQNELMVVEINTTNTVRFNISTMSKIFLKDYYYLNLKPTIEEWKLHNNFNK